jgi:hypothetical protein
VFDHSDTTLSDRAEGELGLVRNTQLPHRHHVEPRVQNTCHLCRNRDSPARQTQHDDIRCVPCQQTCGQLPTRIGAILELHDERR